MWRYSPINELSLDDFAPAAGPEPAASKGSAEARELFESLRTTLGRTAASVLVQNGQAVEGSWSNTRGNPATFEFGPADEVAAATDMLGSVQREGDALVRLNDAFMPDPIFLDVPRGVSVEGPVLVVHWCDPESAAFPRLCVRAGIDAAVSVVEVFAGPTARGMQRSLAVPVTELMAAEDASLSYLSLQTLSDSAWHLARLSARGGRNSSLRTFTVGLGAAYDRVRTDVTVDGKDARSEILSAYLGEGTQVHDIRTLQDHAAPRTNSELLCQGAVAGRSRSVYSGLIRVQRGAVRSDARQTNLNLVLDEGAHADSVPNLDILENDVKCSHASTVGPVDEDQRYYIESRGVAPDVAESLIVRGFFDAIIERGPVPEATALLESEVHVRLDAALADRQVVAGV
ncbi:MAG TPA: SufD family Fe-S cluster assembly protein [Acidimicrobiales bacterium]|nr:SufD family Fe-S cluster assembly protein [Acidimicrobiales bacterium]